VRPSLNAIARAGIGFGARAGDSGCVGRVMFTLIETDADHLVWRPRDMGCYLVNMSISRPRAACVTYVTVALGVRLPRQRELCCSRSRS
jgi:hypothetical protein